MDSTLKALIEAVGIKPEQAELLQLLKDIQTQYGALSIELQHEIAEMLQISPSIITALIRITPSLKTVPYRHIITVCIGKSCRAAGSFSVLKAIQNLLNIETGQISADGCFKLTTRSCVKRCSEAPNILIDGKRCSFTNQKDLLEQLQNLRKT